MACILEAMVSAQSALELLQAAISHFVNSSALIVSARLLSNSAVLCGLGLPLRVG